MPGTVRDRAALLDNISRSAYNHAMSAQKKPAKPKLGRPKGVRMPCGWCGEALTQAELRAHFVTCPKRPKATGIPARSLEQEWLKQHRAEYAGSWIALEGAHLVAQGSSARQVLDAARARGCDLPLVVHIPSEPPLPFGGW